MNYWWVPVVVAAAGGLFTVWFQAEQRPAFVRRFCKLAMWVLGTTIVVGISFRAGVQVGGVLTPGEYLDFYRISGFVLIACLLAFLLVVSIFFSTPKQHAVSKSSEISRQAPETRAENHSER